MIPHRTSAADPARPSDTGQAMLTELRLLRQEHRKTRKASQTCAACLALWTILLIVVLTLWLLGAIAGA